MDSDDYQGEDYTELYPPEQDDQSVSSKSSSNSSSSSSDSSSSSSTSSSTGFISESDDEGLGDDFDATPWVAPSLERAERKRKREIVGGGKLPIWSSSLSKLDIGLGTILYFSFLKFMIGLMAIMFFISIPSLVISYSGSRIPPGSFLVF